MLSGLDSRRICGPLNQRLWNPAAASSQQTAVSSQQPAPSAAISKESSCLSVFAACIRYLRDLSRPSSFEPELSVVMPIVFGFRFVV